MSQQFKEVSHNNFPIFMKEVQELFEQGYRITDFDSSNKMPQQIGFGMYFVIMEFIGNKTTEVVQEAPAVKPKPVPPIRKPKQQQSTEE